MRIAALPALTAILLAGCTPIGPDYARPDLQIADGWLEPAQTGAVDPDWWNEFDDPLLSQLIQQAITSAPDIQIARARMAETRALREAAQGGRSPRINASATAAQTRISENGQFPVASIPGFDPAFSLFDAGFDASWEIDIWGASSRQIEGAAAREEAALWGMRDMQVALAAETARAYIQLRAAQARVIIAQSELDAASQLASLAALRARAGEGSMQEADQAAAAKASHQAALQALQGDVSGAGYLLATLVGALPETIIARLQQNQDQPRVPVPPETITSGIRSELLLRRPDIARAERSFAAASADIGVASADLYPRITLAGSIGMQAQNAGDLAESGSLRYSAGPGFHWPIFSFGRIRAHIRAADARADMAAAAYEKAVIAGLSESESAANRFAAATVGAQLAGLALEREENAFRLARLRFDNGEDDRLALEQARLRLAAARHARLNAQTGQSLAAAAFYKALGGGWQVSE